MAKFKEYNQHQIMLLPPSLEEKIRDGHFARFVSRAVDELDIKGIEERYSEEGCSAYHPRMLIKLFIYGYSIGVRSSRKIQQRTREDIVFMWLAGMQQPDFRTISDFRKDKLGNIKELFKQVLGICFELGLIKGENVCLDGTKIEASSNSNKITYRKILLARKDKYEEEIDKIFDEAEEIDRLEDELYGDWDGYTLKRDASSEEIRKALKKLEGKKKKNLKKLVDKKGKLAMVKGALKRIGKNRNTMGNTDSDASMMQIKRDCLGSGYNVQAATENQIVVGYGVYQRANDLKLLEPMIKEIKASTGKKPKAIIADKGYGCKDNYKLLKKKKIKAAVPWGRYDIEKRMKKNNTYNPSESEEIETYKTETMAYLESKEGKHLQRKRKYDVEPVFGDIKYNMGFRKFLLRTLPRVSIETGLIVLAHNLKKMSIAINREKVIKVGI